MAGITIGASTGYAPIGQQGSRLPQKPVDDPNSIYESDGQGNLRQKPNSTFISPLTGLPTSSGEFNVQNQQVGKANQAYNAAQAQQQAEWAHQNAMAAMQENAAQMGLAQMGGMLSGTGGGITSGSSSSSSGGGINAPSFNGGSSMVGGAPGASAPGSPRLTPPDTTAANAASFARAKDQVGLQTRGALTGLAGAMAGRGTVGSGVEGRGQAAVIGQGQQQLGEVSREQSIQDAALAQKNAELAYSGGITQRGQDLTHTDTMNSQMLTGRGQDMSYASTSRGQDIALQGQLQAAKQAQQDLALKQLSQLMGPLY